MLANVKNATLERIFPLLRRGPGKRACQVGEADAGPTEGVRVAPGYDTARVEGGVNDHGHTPAES